MDSSATRPYPVFVGGTGRSGTTIAARLLATHPRYVMAPVELKFHTGRNGLAALGRGRTTIKAVVGQTIEHWKPVGARPGLTGVIGREDLDAALASFKQDARIDLRSAAAALMDTVFRTTPGSTSWIEHTPRTVMEAPWLAALFPNARFIHMVRDGRDVACSVAGLGWIDSPAHGLEWWGKRFLGSVRGAARVPADRVLEVSFEALVRDDRERQLSRLMRFLELDFDPELLGYFRTEVSPERSNIGRWRDELPLEEHQAFTARYEEILARAAQHLAAKSGAAQLPRRFRHLHHDRHERSYAPTFFDPEDAATPFLNPVHAGLEREVGPIRGKLEPADHSKLYEAAYFAGVGVLEIGRLAGKSTVIMALAIRDAGRRVPMWSLELHERLVASASRSLEERGLRELVEFVQGDSATSIESIAADFDVVFVDGDHSYRGLCRDLAALWGRIAPGGCVLFHDYFHPANDDPDDEAYGVREAVDELAAPMGLEFRGRFGGIAMFEQVSAPSHTRPRDERSHAPS